MPREITHHGAILEAIRQSGIISELVERQDGHFKYELDLEVIVYGEVSSALEVEKEGQDLSTCMLPGRRATISSITAGW